MEDKVLLACAEAKAALTDEQSKAAGALGWRTVPDAAEGSNARFLVRPVRSKEEAVSAVEDLALSERKLHLTTGLVFEPYLNDPLNAPASVIWAPSSRQETPEEPPKPSAGEEKPGNPAEEGPQPNIFPTIPEYVWKSLQPDKQEELAEKLVEYVVNRSATAAYGSSFDDAALFAHLDEVARPGLAKRILEQKHGMTSEQVRREGLVNGFQEQRVNLMKEAVASATEVNKHLERWRALSDHVKPFLKTSSIVACVFVAALFVLLFIGRINGWEMAVLAFVFALMAVSPATLLLIGRPLKGLDEWSPSKQEMKTEEAAKEEPAKDKGKAA